MGDVDLAFYSRLRDQSNAEIATTFTWRVPERMNVAVQVCDRHRDPDRRAIRWLGVDGSTRDVSFAELAEMSDRAAGALVAAGVARGDRVFTMLPRVPEHWATLLGVLKLGGIWSCLSTTFGPDGVAVRVADGQPSVIVTARRYEPAVRTAADAAGATVILVDDDGPDGLPARMSAAPASFDVVDTAADEPAFLFYTSGTTGRPKGSVHGHQLVVGALALIGLVLDLRPEDTMWPTSDLAWVTGVLLSLGTLGYGQGFVTFEGEFDAGRWWDIIRAEGVTAMFTVPTAWRMLRAGEAGRPDEGGPVPIRRLGTVGEPLDPETLAWSRARFGTPIVECYGQTENGAGLCTNRADMPIKPGSLGPALPFLTVAVVDEHGQEVPVGTVGEIVSRPDYPALTQGYWQNPEATASMLHDGWQWTGDLARMDEDGYFWYQSRQDDLISSGGYRIGPTEIEAALLAHPAVAEAGVVGKPDPQRGQIVKAWIALRAGYQGSDELAAELVEHCRRTAGGWNHPREVGFLDELPKTVTGKIRRVELREIDARS
ncbi:acyl-CoA synthetase [Pseudonocardia sp. WMMC193]|uniref:acyl-CoA synthetase n=1 Tax=Pseudonocardia sp. WMMC193 TaxID=2911965 RepID=UPI001F3C9370|nr:acyl-CoA synthetase [Pseudonocardia sp. WMMC193]MCF7550775.1 acyl-CoA synthetase [Pseudonocardia sp. WMMC193]